MIKSNFYTEYHAPKCKVVNVHVASSLLSGSELYGEKGAAGGKLGIINEDDEEAY